MPSKHSFFLGLALALGLAARLEARSFSGFFTPDFVRGAGPPYIPVSTYGSIELSERLSGELHLRELGTFRVDGTLSAGRVEMKLHGSAGEVAGQADGKLEGTRLELVLRLFRPEPEVWARGQLDLEAAAEWRASEVTKEKNLGAARNVTGTSTCW